MTIEYDNPSPFQAIYALIQLIENLIEIMVN